MALGPVEPLHWCLCKKLTPGQSFGALFQQNVAPQHTQASPHKNSRGCTQGGGSNTKPTSITEILHCPFHSRLLTRWSFMELRAKQRHCCLCTVLPARRRTLVFSLGDLHNPKGSLYLQLGERNHGLPP